GRHDVDFARRQSLSLPLLEIALPLDVLQIGESLGAQGLTGDILRRDAEHRSLREMEPWGLGRTFCARRPRNDRDESGRTGKSQLSDEVSPVHPFSPS